MHRTLILTAVVAACAGSAFAQSTPPPLPFETPPAVAPAAPTPPPMVVAPPALPAPPAAPTGQVQGLASPTTPPTARPGEETIEDRMRAASAPPPLSNAARVPVMPAPMRSLSDELRLLSLRMFGAQIEARIAVAREVVRVSKPGARLPGGWVVTAINDSGVSLVRGTQKRELLFSVDESPRAFSPPSLIPNSGAMVPPLR